VAQTYLLDTGVLIAAQTSGDAHHDDCIAFFEAASRVGAILLVSPGLDYDLERAEAQRRVDRLEWVADQGIDRTPGAFTLDVSALDSGDELLSETDAADLSRLRGVLGTESDRQDARRWRRRQIDAHHAGGALLADAVLVTVDKNDLLKHADEAQAAVGLEMLTPAEARRRLTGS